MPSKSDEYGPKYELGVNVNSKHVAIGFPCVGNDASCGTDDRVSDQLVLKLLKHYLAKGRNVTADNYFTLIKLARVLKSMKTSPLGTMNKIMIEIPSDIKNMKEELCTKLQQRRYIAHCLSRKKK